MTNKLDVRSTALALATTSAIVSLVCAALIVIAPQQTISLFGKIFHGIDITKIATTSVILSDVVIGVILVTVLGGLAGALFAKIYNYFVKRQ